MNNPTVNLTRSVGLMTLATSLWAAALAAQPPATDIAYVQLSETGEVVAGSFVRVTDRELYDNQPAFLNDDTLLYTAMQRGPDGELSTKIVRYDLASRTSRSLIDTPESEYSPLRIPGRNAISVVRDYGDQKQQLWSVDLAGDKARTDENLLPAINPIGYHAWVDERRLLLFVLGEPHTLQLATVGAEPGRVLAQNPGRALARLPDSPRMSFVHQVAEGEWWLCSIDVDAEHPATSIRRLLLMPECSEDYVWSADGSVWTARDSELLRAPEFETRAWQSVADLKEYGVRGISRMTFDTAGRTLVFVFTR